MIAPRRRIISTSEKTKVKRTVVSLSSVFEFLAMEIMKTYPKLKSVTVLLKKPEAPISADFDYVAVEETITREEYAEITNQ